MKLAARSCAAVAAVAAVASVAACSSVGLGISLPIGRMGGITIGGSVPIPPREEVGKPSPAASAPEGSASAATSGAPAASTPASTPAKK